MNRSAPWLAGLAIAFTALAGTASAAAPAASPHGEPGFDALAQVVVDTAPPWLFGDEDTLAFAAAELHQERVTKGAAYCADAVHETVQWLHDAAGGAANRIVRRQLTRLCRDGDGRTRQELDRDGRSLVYLRDPVSREAWVLDPQRRTARRLSPTAFAPGGAAGVASPVWRDYAERMREWAREMSRVVREPGGETARLPPPPPPVVSRAVPPPAPPALPVPPAPAPLPAPAALPLPPPAVAPLFIERGAGAHQLRIMRVEPGQAMPAPPPLPGLSWRAHSLAPRGPGVVTPLPPKEIEGLRAHGERTTWTIEAGRIGNERPIEIVREVWTSPELLLTLATRDFDPRSGEVAYRLQNLRRGEPDPALMRVPADYQQLRPPGPRAPASAPRR